MISPNHDDRPQGVPVDHLVLHYTGMRSAHAALERLCDPAAKVSSHYLVEEDGAVHALVPEPRRAWHAGISFWRGASALNDRSIGIEIVNPGHEWGYVPFPRRQVDAVIGLCRDIVARHPVPPRNVVGHSDIAPDRKQDPGELFPWPCLAAAGVGLWTDASADGADILAELAAIGYDTSLPAAIVVAAFQRRFRPARVDGVADAQTRGRAAAIRTLFEASAPPLTKP
ncbi:N-acetylmuramoyl-L-alanine amidase [Acidocella sp. C78]|uniref:N-acetylmuramoyl-L-alanine amidase n=1 Tax=Acidocella sp. C78 TaxID=1671486 RepID=UPI00191B902A|nr:N-acetylmuramoyl-L-alanine amidase [Acidocella sp. C78]